MGCSSSSAAVAQSQQPTKHSSAIKNKFRTFDEVMADLRAKGLESCNLIVGIDCTKSNMWSGLHTISDKPNPYERVLTSIAKTLQSFDDDNMIPMFGFGDSLTTNRSVFPFSPAIECHGLDAMLHCYRQVIPRIQMLGPTSLAPLIGAACNIVRATGRYHILIAITDGIIDDVAATTAAIVAASTLPLSIVTVGVGPGPWATMKEFDDGLPERAFDNFQFVEYEKQESDVNFAVEALQEIPEQYRTIKRRGLLGLEPAGATCITEGLVVMQPAAVYNGSLIGAYAVPVPSAPRVQN